MIPMLYLIGCYGSISTLVFLKYLRRFLKDSTVSYSDYASWTVIVIASFLWPISLPLSALERNIQKPQSSRYSVQSQVNLIYLNQENDKDSGFPLETSHKDAA